MSGPSILDLGFRIFFFCGFEVYISLSVRRNMRLFIDLRCYTRMFICWEYNNVHLWSCGRSIKSSVDDILARNLILLFGIKILILIIRGKWFWFRSNLEVLTSFLWNNLMLKNISMIEKIKINSRVKFELWIPSKKF